MTITTALQHRTHRPGRAPVLLTVVAALVALLTITPIGYVVAQAAAAGWHETWSVLSNPATRQLLAHTVELTAAVMAASLILGGAGAWLIECTDLPGRRVWALLLPLPVVVPAFVSAYAWVSVTPAMSGFAGALMVMALRNYPLVLLPTAAVLRGMDPSLHETAASLGHGPWSAWWRITLPHAAPALCGGAVLVGLETLAEFGAFSMLNYSTFTTTIYDQYNLTFDGPTASMLASVLVLGCLILLTADLRIRGSRRYARVGRGSPRPARRHHLRAAAPVAVLGSAATVAAAIGVPVGILVYWLHHGSTARLPIDSLGKATATSLGLSVAAAVVTTLLALPVAILAARHRSRLSTIIERGTYIAHGLPGVVIGLALVSIAVHELRPVYQTTGVLVVGYAIIFLPLALIGIRSSIERVPTGLTEAAHSLGAGPVKSFVRVTLPLIAPGIGAAAGLVFLFTMTELTVTLMLAPPGLQTLSMAIWSDTTNLDYAAAAPYAATMIAISAVPTYLLTSRLGRARA